MPKAHKRKSSCNESVQELKYQKAGETLNNESSPTKLTAEQKARIELNRQKALLIRQDKLNKQRVYNKVEEDTKKIIRVDNTKLIDTGSGFFIEEDDQKTEEKNNLQDNIVKEPAPLLNEDQSFCDECNVPFSKSYLMEKFNCCVCDKCRDPDEKHCLIARTDAKNHYLLKDVDFDRREPLLQYILKKNPHNPQWGDMKLYLKLQIEKRALEIWGSEEALEEAIEKKEEKRDLTKQRNYMKKMKELRMNVRSSLYSRTTKLHEHEYGQEEYLEESDEYKKTCSTCGHSYIYEKM